MKLSLFLQQTKTMAGTENVGELVDYVDDENETTDVSMVTATKKDVKGSYASIHSSSFRDLLLKPELLRAILDKGFEHPSEGECLPFFHYDGFSHTY